MKISEKIKYIRQKLGINQKELAATLQVTQATISRYEVGIHTPDYDFLDKFVSILNVNPEWLFSNSNECFTDEDRLDLLEVNIGTLKDLQLMLHQYELYTELSTILFSNIVENFEFSEEIKEIMLKFLTALKFEGNLPLRPFIFLYYIFQRLMEDNEKIAISNHKKYLIDIIFSYKKLLWHNYPSVSKKIKNEIIVVFDKTITEEECQILTNNAQKISREFEKNMLASSINFHKNQSKLNFFND